MTAPTSSPLGRFLEQHAIPDYAALCARADADSEWFWRAVMDFHQIHFFRPFERLVDTSEGVPFARWCIGGTTNLASP